MKFPVWIKPALFGAVGGAIVLAVVGFSWGGWTTAGGASEIARKQSLAAVAAALIPYCIERSQSDPNSVALLTEFRAAPTYSRRGFIEKAGWATPLGAEKPNMELAQACQLALSAAVTTS